MKIYTKKGDDGMTSLADGTRVAKDDARIEACGAVDELNAHIGLLISFLKDEKTIDFLQSLQHSLFTVGAIISSNKVLDHGNTMEKDVQLLESTIDKLQDILPPVTSFVLPGGTVAAAQAHVCRTVCRRAERRVTALRNEAFQLSLIPAFLNRLSDYLFLLSRNLNFIDNKDEKTWSKTCR
jgi:cob(I)alamin adenosyltransferase